VTFDMTPSPKPATPPPEPDGALRTEPRENSPGCSNRQPDDTLAGASSKPPTPPPPPPPPPPPSDEVAAGDDAATLELVWQLQQEEEARQREREEGEARLASIPAADDDAESIALAIRLQQQEDDEALRAALGPAGAALLANEGEGDDEREGAVSPSQYSYETLVRLGEALGEVSRGASANAVGSLRTLSLCEARADSGVRLGEKCSICCMEWEEGDSLRVLPCGHAEHVECLGEWLKRSKACPLCAKEIPAE